MNGSDWLQDCCCIDQVLGFKSTSAGLVYCGAFRHPHALYGTGPRALAAFFLRRFNGHARGRWRSSAARLEDHAPG